MLPTFARRLDYFLFRGLKTKYFLKWLYSEKIGVTVATFVKADQYRADLLFACKHIYRKCTQHRFIVCVNLTLYGSLLYCLVRLKRKAAAYQSEHKEIGKLNYYLHFKSLIMQQLSLEQLEVESYATQPGEQELTDLKGGTGAVCRWVGKNATWIYDKVEGYLSSNDSSGSGNSGTTYYGIDSVRVDSTSYYGIDSVKFGGY